MFVFSVRAFLVMTFGGWIFSSAGAQELSLDCAALFENAPEGSAVPEEDGPRLLNGEALRGKVRDLYAWQWTRSAYLQVLVRPDGRLSHGCVLKGSGHSVFDLAALETARDAEFRPATLNGEKVEAWAAFSIVGLATAPAIRAGRYQPLSSGGMSDPEVFDVDRLDIQAAVLDYLVLNNDGHDAESPNRAICLGVGPNLPLLDSPPELISRLQPTALPTFPATACDLDLERQFRGRRGPRLVLLATDEPAIALWVDVVEPEGAIEIEVEAGYYEGVLSSARYGCTVRRTPGGWAVAGCERHRIS